MLSPWTKDKITLLRELWPHEPPLYAREIGRRLGNMTKGQVIGKAHRLGLGGKKPVPPKERRKVASPARERHGIPKTQSLPPGPVTPILPTTDGVHILDLEPHHCRSVIGYGKDKLARFCGAQKASRLSPYTGQRITLAWCEPHCYEYFGGSQE